jgi:hypothetical protein
VRRQNGRLENERWFGVSSRVCGVEGGWLCSPIGKVRAWKPGWSFFGWWKTAEASMDVAPRLTHQEKITGDDHHDSVARIIDKSLLSSWNVGAITGQYSGAYGFSWNPRGSEPKS